MKKYLSFCVRHVIEFLNVLTLLTDAVLRNDALNSTAPSTDELMPDVVVPWYKP